MHITQKLIDLKAYLLTLNSVLVAFSGGVDSSLLLKAASESLGKSNVMAVTARSPLTPQADLVQASCLALEIGATHRIIDSTELALEEVVSNPPDRCYHCKLHKFNELAQVALQENIPWIIEGSNASDLDDYRPGLTALKSLPNVRSPYLELGITKAEIRDMARALGLSSWDQPSRACLASRVPYGQRLDTATLESIDQAESALLAMGLKNFRVRHHGTVARIEVAVEEMSEIMNPEAFQEISTIVKACGFTYVTIDLDGYRTGSLNADLTIIRAE
ncbi:MAG: ATP-dependent sacrificial sulfur transferase LarE [Acidobacteriota bacterium]